MTYSVSAVAAFELPEELLEQKPGYDVETFMQLAMAAPERIFAYIIEDGEDEIACFWAHPNNLYKNLHIDTFVVDKEARKDDVVQQCMRIALKVCEALAIETGMEKVSWSSPPKLADHMVKLIDNEKLHVTEWVLAIDVGEAEEKEPDEQPA